MGWEIKKIYLLLIIPNYAEVQNSEVQNTELLGGSESLLKVPLLFKCCFHLFLLGDMCKQLKLSSSGLCCHQKHWTPGYNLLSLYYMLYAMDVVLDYVHD